MNYLPNYHGRTNYPLNLNTRYFTPSFIQTGQINPYTILSCFGLKLAHVVSTCQYSQEKKQTICRAHLPSISPSIPPLPHLVPPLFALEMGAAPGGGARDGDGGW